MKTVGDRIRSYRKERGLSQEELADLAGLHVTYIGKLERAEKVCTVEVLDKVTRALDVSLEEFFRYIQPDRGGRESTMLARIVNRMMGRSFEEQRRILQIIDLVFDDRAK
jgi:transcriptional regulator with XRE-family HTH domain